jgi:hypothetical protein
MAIGVGPGYWLQIKHKMGWAKLIWANWIKQLKFAISAGPWLAWAWLASQAPWSLEIKHAQDVPGWLSGPIVPTMGYRRKEEIRTSCTNLKAVGSKSLGHLPSARRESCDNFIGPRCHDYEVTHPSSIDTWLVEIHYRPGMMQMCRHQHQPPHKCI